MVVFIYIKGQVNLKSLLCIGALFDFLEGRREVGQMEMDRMKSGEFERSKRKE